MNPEHKMQEDPYVPHGRGGAGNLGPSSKVGQDDLSTPVLRGEVFTTGRGGNGNMALNDHDNSDYARQAQDLDGTPRKLSDSDHHYGRGGAANVGKPTPEELAAAKMEYVRWELSGKGEPPVDHSKQDYRGWAEKGKDLLFGRRKKGNSIPNGTRRDESLVSADRNHSGISMGREF